LAGARDHQHRELGADATNGGAQGAIEHISENMENNSIFSEF
jgi:hypothetical protein